MSIPAPAPEATATLVRHAESEFNAALGGDEDLRFDDRMALLADCGLTPAGAASTRAIKTPKGAYVVVSPLRRALDTAKLLFPGIETGEVQHEVSGLATEHVADICDIGTPLSELRTRYPWMNDEGLEEIWWPTGLGSGQAWQQLRSAPGAPLETEDSLAGRAAALKARLRSLHEANPGKPIFVVTHAALIFTLTSYELDGTTFGNWVANTEAVEIGI